VATSTREDVMRNFMSEVRAISDACSLPEGVALILLANFQFNRNSLTSMYFEEPQKALLVRKELLSTAECCLTRASDVAAKTAAAGGAGAAGGVSSSSSGSSSGGQSLDCSICCNDSIPANEYIHLGCDHSACLSCWKHFLYQKVNEGDVFDLKCFSPKCNVAISISVLRELLEPAMMDKFNDFVVNKIVHEHQSLSFCPEKHCGKVVTLPPNFVDSDVQCPCGYKFCSKCSNEAHTPSTCNEAKDWEKKGLDDSMTSKWIKEHTKDCPKCHNAIEKNGG